jgi:hypothetical protein
MKKMFGGLATNDASLLKGLVNGALEGAVSLHIIRFRMDFQMGSHVTAVGLMK